jgi:hypothetical protein
MSDKQNDSNPLSDFLRERADVVIPNKDRRGGLSIGEVLAWRHWFASRQRLLKSSGGRPTNPAWTVKRQIPFSPEVWEELEKRSEACSSEGKSIAPGQVAGFLLEDAISQVNAGSAAVSGEVNDDVKADLKLAEPTHDPNFDNWEMPGIFSGVAA